MKNIKNIIVSGAAGFIGSHAAEFYAKDPNNKIIAIDNLSRQRLMGKKINYADFNLNFLKQFKNIEVIISDIGDKQMLKNVLDNNEIDLIIHAAGQPGVPTSVQNPEYDFESNVIGSFNLLESVRKSTSDPAMVFCSTNKTFGDNVNNINIIKKESRYEFEQAFSNGVSEIYPNDLCEHTPYGVSKLCADHYFQEYGKIYGMKTGVFRMSCIYGTRQLGVEEQGWVAHFIISAINNKPINIFGDGLQIRDLLYVTDLVNAFNKFYTFSKHLKGEVFCIGGGPKNTMSLIEMLHYLTEKLGNQYSSIKLKYQDWRPSDQKVYVSNINKAREVLNWTPEINPFTGIDKVIEWVIKNREKLII